MQLNSVVEQALHQKETKGQIGTQQLHLLASILCLLAACGSDDISPTIDEQDSSRSRFDSGLDASEMAPADTGVVDTGEDAAFAFTSWTSEPWPETCSSGCAEFMKSCELYAFSYAGGATYANDQRLLVACDTPILPVYPGTLDKIYPLVTLDCNCQ